MGLTLEEASGPPIEIWAPNEVPCALFIDLRTQWRCGAAGPIGLDYNVLFHKLDRMQLASERYEEIERAVRFMEDAALEFFSEQRK